MQHGSLLALGFTVGRYLAKGKIRTMELHDVEQPNIAVMPEQEQLIKSTTETIGNFLPKTLLHVTGGFF